MVSSIRCRFTAGFGAALVALSLWACGEGGGEGDGATAAGADARARGDAAAADAAGPAEGGTPDVGASFNCFNLDPNSPTHDCDKYYCETGQVLSTCSSDPTLDFCAYKGCYSASLECMKGNYRTTCDALKLSDCKKAEDECVMAARRG